jgi:predicted glycosyltransferase
MLNTGVPAAAPLSHAHENAPRAWSPPEAMRPDRLWSSRQKASRLPLLFYCHGAPGAGAIVRSTLVQALSSRFRVVVAIGGEALRGFDAPPSIEVIRLPARNGRAVDDERRRLLMHTYLTVNPAIVLIEQFPFCEPELAGEIMPVLEAAAANQQTRLIACSAQMPDAAPADTRRDDDAQEVADRYFDVVLVHADPRLGRLEESFQPRQPLRVPVRYTGFVGAEPSDESLCQRGREIVVAAGSGRSGMALFAAALAAFDLLPPAERLRMRIITGPSLSDDEFASLQAGAAQRAGVAVERSVPDLRALLAGAAASVTDCAYDTVVASLRAGVPAVVVPADDGDDEQRARAQRIAALGAARVLEPDRLSGPLVAEAIAATLGAIPRRLDLDVSGALATVRVVARLSDPEQEFSWTFLGREMV